VKGDLVEEAKKLKQQAGAGMVILGSASIVEQLTAAKLIDEYQIAVNPIVLGDGKSMFTNLPERVSLRLKDSRTFRNGNVFLKYEPA
jgi:dihydrofolate reductase